MKKIALLLLAAITIVSCKEDEPKDYVSISGKITNVNDQKKLTILDRDGFKREIKVADDGTFSDTLSVIEGKYMFTDGNEYGSIYLKNNNEISFTLDTKEFDESLRFSGDGAKESNFYVSNTLLSEDMIPDDIFDLDKEGFERAFEKLAKGYNDLKSNSGLPEDFFVSEDEEFESMKKGYTAYHAEKIAMREALPKGSASPIFENYENYKGGETSLVDLKGKYVYIDVWATWCGPCKAEIPSLKEVEAKYHGKNIEFVSISVDNGRGYKDNSVEASKEGWKKMIAEKEMGGIQLFADNGWKSEFIQNYKINGIPRFILIGPDGTIVNADAPRPSSSKLIELFDELKI